MTERSDTALLDDWSTKASEGAFAELARRYGGLLYHAAIRRTGRGDLAAEAAQNALLILARKAPRLGGVPSLAGWLHRTVCYEAAKLLRRERRHDARMKQLPAPDGPDEGEENWQEVAPLLDQALDSLPAKDREVIFLRYFQGLSFEEMARRFGGGAPAWRQRGSRSVEKLRLALNKRGAAVSGSALTTGLGSALSQTAPAPFLAALASSPAAGASALSWAALASHSVHFMKLHPATWVLATLIFSTIPLGLQASANAAVRGRIVALENSASHGSSDAVEAERSTARTLPAVGRSAKQSVLRLAEIIDEGRSGSRLADAEADRWIKDLSNEQLEELLRESILVELPAKKRFALVATLFAEYATHRKSQIDAGKVLSMAALLSDQLDMKGQEEIWGRAGFAAKSLARQDTEKAIAWYREQVQAGRLDCSRLNLQLPAEIHLGLREGHPEAAKVFYDSLAEDERIPVIHYFRSVGTPEELLEMAAKFEDPAKRQNSVTMLFRYGTKDKSPAEARAWLDRSGVEPGGPAAALFAIAAEGDPYREDGGVQYHAGMKTHQIAERIAWLKGPAIGGESPEAIGIFLANTMSSAPGQTKEALDAEWQQNPDQEMLAAYIRHAGTTVPGVADALDRYRLLTDLEGREEILRQLLATPAAKEVLDMIRKEGMSDEDLDESQLPPELFR
ncbi:RNA polymerase sigma factor [Luteolibacter sp. Populi]|uniref:RNA polymerase sigma factor n=1 Tax=Luteolibacter sp. Populi TaxID=3230487 RepID=UPI0034674FA8